MTNAVTGYGSLISRTSFSARFTEELVEEGIVGPEELVEVGAIEDEEELEEYVAEVEEADPGDAIQMLSWGREASDMEGLVERNILRDERELEKYEQMIEEEENNEELAKKMLLESTIREETNSAYDTGEFGYDDITRERAEKLWKELNEDQDILPVPVKFPGTRGYWFESSRGGTMTTADRSEEDEMNGVVYIGVSDEQQDAIEADEGESYRMLELDWDELDMYAPEKTEELMDEHGLEAPGSVKVFYTNPFGSSVNKQTARTMNERYQDGIEQAIDEQLAEQYGRDVAEEFLDDFVSTTYVNPVPGAPTTFNDEITAALQAQLGEVVEDYMERQDREVKQFANTIEQHRNAVEAYNELFN